MNKQYKINKMISGVLFALLSLLAGSAAAAGIADTRHNLSTSNVLTTKADGTAGVIKSSDQTEICIFCHTPHSAIKNDNIPLWNHTLPAVGITYGVYTSPTFNGAVSDGGDIAEVGGVTEATAAVSNLCLSCHDGSVAINAMNNPSNANPTTTMTVTTMPVGATNLGSATDALKNDHPVNFTYDAGLVGRDGGTGLKDPTTLTGVKLFSAKVQCASCHDPHSTNATFLRVVNTGSNLCLSCHIK